MKVTQVYPSGKELSIDAAGLRALLAEIPLRSGAWVANFVTTIDGATVGETGSSRDITNDADFQALLALRDSSDFILTSAKTARLERYKTSRKPLVLVSGSGDFSGIPAVESGGSGDVILISPVSPAPPAADSIPFRHLESVTAFKEAFPEAKVAVESGVQLTRWLIGAGFIDGLVISVVGAADSTPQQAVAGLLGRLGVSALDAPLIWAAAVPELDTLLTRWDLPGA